MGALISLDGLVEALNFKQITVRIFEKTMVNAEFGIVRGHLTKFYAFCA